MQNEWFQMVGMMRLRESYFFEIPVYRCSSEDYQSEIEELEEEHIRKYGDLSRLWATPLLYKYRKRVGPWQFNQIVAYLRLFVDFGRDVIKAECWRIEQKRIVKHQGKKKFIIRPGNAIEVWFSRNESSVEIYSRLLESLEMLQKQKRYRNRYIDLRAFREIAPYIDWRSFFDS